MALPEEKSESILVRFGSRETPKGVSIQTVDRLAQQTGLSKTEVIHLALRQLANRCLPKYGMDDGPLTDAQIEAIRAASHASQIPRERFTAGLFKKRP